MARRNTQELIEILVQTTGASLNRRLTQEVVEAVVDTEGASLNRRITQIVIEVPRLPEIPVILGAPDDGIPYPDITYLIDEKGTVTLEGYFPYKPQGVHLGFTKERVKPTRG